MYPIKMINELFGKSPSSEFLKLLRGIQTKLMDDGSLTGILEQ